MVVGIFKKKYFWNVFCLICGLLLIGMAIFIKCVDSEASLDLLAIVALGLAISAFSIFCLLFNFGAFIEIEENRIRAKHNWFEKIDCDISEVDFAITQNFVLTIQLKNGKRHTIMGLENSFEICAVIRRLLPFEATETAEALIQKLNKLKTSRKVGIGYVCAGVAFMFAFIFVTAILTGEREMYDFTQTDWVIFCAMCVLELATVIITFYLAGRAGKKIVPIEKLKYYIQRTIIETTPLPSGNATSVFIDDNYFARMIFFGYPNESSIYYVVQEIQPDYSLETVFTSEVFADEQQLPASTQGLIDITKNFLD
ncbi:MAG: hypothetical protein IJ370_05195 [Oscillospiraceae bacterium]|nr:hypothetical protein [Oscillospiraceae bacterium]